MARSYAVIWRVSGPTLYVGRLEPADGCFRLVGADASGRPAEMAVAYDDILRVREASALDRLRGRRTAMLEIARTAPLALASIDRPGTWLELVARLSPASVRA
jgi:hypothetical protein